MPTVKLTPEPYTAIFEKWKMTGWCVRGGKRKKGGPAKRLYEITGEGEKTLHTWAVTINFNKQRLEKVKA